jgi:hypothetical protein
LQEGLVQDSLAAVVDSLVRHAISVRDSTSAAVTTKPWYYRIIQDPLFNVLVGIMGFFFGKWYQRLEQSWDHKRKRKAVAGRVRQFLEMAADQLKPFVEHLEAESPIIPGSAMGYARADYPMTHLATFAGIRGSLEELDDLSLVKDIVLWHQVSTFDLQDLIDYVSMSPADYSRKYATKGGEARVPLYGEAIRAALHADMEKARELAARPEEIAGRREQPTHRR